MNFRAAWNALRGRETKASATWPLMVGSAGFPIFSDRTFSAFADEGYAKNVICYRCVSMIAQSAAMVMWNVFDDRDEILEDGELVSLIQRPNPWQGLAELMESAIAYYLLSGDAYIEAAGPNENAPPIWLYALRPDAMGVKLSKETGSPRQYIWKSRSGEKTWEMNPVTGEGRIMHWRSFHPKEQWSGLAAAEPAAASIDQHNEASRWNQWLLQNSASPSGAVVFAPKEGTQPWLTPEQRADIQRVLAERHTSPSAAGRTMILEGGMDWKQIGLTPKDMDWVQGKDVSAREIALAYGVPGQLVGIPDSQTYSNVREARLALWEETVIPLLARFRGRFNTWVHQWWPDLRVEYDLDTVSALTLRRERKAEGLERLVAAGIITRNEARSELGYEDKPGGDALLVPATLFPLGEDDAPEDDDADKAIRDLGYEDAAQLAYGTNGGGKPIVLPAVPLRN